MPFLPRQGKEGKARHLSSRAISDYLLSARLFPLSLVILIALCCLLRIEPARQFFSLPLHPLLPPPPTTKHALRRLLLLPPEPILRAAPHTRQYCFSSSPIIYGLLVSRLDLDSLATRPDRHPRRPPCLSGGLAAVVASARPTTNSRPASAALAPQTPIPQVRLLIY